MGLPSPSCVCGPGAGFVYVVSTGFWVIKWGGRAVFGGILGPGPFLRLHWGDGLAILSGVGKREKESPPVLFKFSVSACIFSYLFHRGVWSPLGDGAFGGNGVAVCAGGNGSGSDAQACF